MKDYPYLERFLAAIIDISLVSLLSSIILVPAILAIVMTITLNTDTTASDISMGMSSSNPNNIIIILLMISAILLFALLLIFIGHYYYYVNRPSKNNGQTFGKGFMNLRIARSDGQSLSQSTLLWRYVMMTLIAQLIGPLVYVTIFFDEEHRSLYDLIVGTKVVRVVD